MEWNKTKLKDIAKKITKGSTPTSYGYAFRSRGIPFVKVENLADGRIDKDSISQYISSEAHNFQKRSQLQPDDVLFSIAGTIGRVAIVKDPDVPANTNQAVAIIRGTEKYLRPTFLKNLLESHISLKVKGKARGGAMNNVSLSDLKELEVVLPSFDEQDLIIETIETQFTRLDAVVKALNSMKKRLQVYRNSVLKAAFFNKLITTDSKLVDYQIKDISKNIQYGLTSKSGINYKGPRYLRITDIQNRKVNWEAVPFAKETEKLDAYYLNEEDLVFARTGATVGKSFLIKEHPKNAVFASYLIRIMPDLSKVYPNLLWYYFQSPMYWHEISKKQRGIGQPNVNGQILSKLDIKLPESIEDQEFLSEEIESRFSVIDKLEQTVDASLVKAEHLRKSILKSAFEGRLVEYEGGVNV